MIPNKLNRDLVAKKAGVSSATVSRAYNNPNLVSPEKRKRILSSAEKLGYVPNRTASALRRNDTGIVLLVEPQKENYNPEERYYSWFYADVIRSIMQEMNKTMYHLSHFPFSKPLDILKIKSGKMCDAIIVYGVTDETILYPIKKSGLPYVCCFQTDILKNYNRSYIDEIQGGYLAGKELKDAGFVHPVHITANLAENKICDARYKGFEKAFEGDRVRLIQGELGIRGGYESACKIIGNIKSKAIDSVFIVNDLTAIGVIHALMENGVKIPQDVSLIGYDNLPFTSTLPFKLTTIDVSIGRNYQEAAKLLLKSMQDGSKIDHRVEPVLIKGESIKIF
jgi:DNA-binding LacI/PurR family transcriptional regulator